MPALPGCQAGKAPSAGPAVQSGIEALEPHLGPVALPAAAASAAADCAWRRPTQGRGRGRACWTETCGPGRAGVREGTACDRRCPCSSGPAAVRWSNADTSAHPPTSQGTLQGPGCWLACSRTLIGQAAAALWLHNGNYATHCNGSTAVMPLCTRSCPPTPQHPPELVVSSASTHTAGRTSQPPSSAAMSCATSSSRLGGWQPSGAKRSAPGAPAASGTAAGANRAANAEVGAPTARVPPRVAAAAGSTGASRMNRCWVGAAVGLGVKPSAATAASPVPVGAVSRKAGNAAVAAAAATGGVATGTGLSADSRLRRTAPTLLLLWSPLSAAGTRASRLTKHAPTSAASLCSPPAASC